MGKFWLFPSLSGKHHVCNEELVKDKSVFLKFKAVKVRMRENWHAVIQWAWCCSLQTCSDRSHMPCNLEFISPPFLISAPVIQINSNEISRGKAPFGWGVCSSPPHGPIQCPLPWVKAKHPPLLLTCGGINLRCCHSQTQSLYPERASTPLMARGDAL